MQAEIICFSDEALEAVEYYLNKEATIEELEEMDEGHAMEVCVCEGKIPATWWQPSEPEREYFVAVSKDEVTNWENFYKYKQTLARLKGEAY